MRVCIKKCKHNKYGNNYKLKLTKYIEVSLKLFYLMLGFI